MKLQILISQYNENEKILANLLNSIMIQQGVNIQEDIEVIIGNDGSETILSEDFLNKFSFQIQYLRFEHGGLGACRGKLFNHATADYVMFCDADDMFQSVTALSNIFADMNKGYGIIVYDFYEEVKLQNKMIYVNHHHDNIFVHGKIYKRQFLLDHSIIWHPELGTNQDSCFNVLAITLAMKNNTLLFNDLPIYLWKWNDKSITRGEEYHTQKSWCDMIESYEYNIKDFLNRGYGEQAKYYSLYCLQASFFEMLDPRWEVEECKLYKEKTIKRLQKFYKKHKLLIQYLDPEQRKKGYLENKQKAVKKGIAEEKITFEQWMNQYIITKD